MYRSVILSLLTAHLLLSSCNEKRAAAAPAKTTAGISRAEQISRGWKTLSATDSLIQDGDLICRRGGDIISFSIANFSTKDKEYSHSGIAFRENGQIWVYHTYLGTENPSGKMMREPLDSFCSPRRERGFGVFRFGLSHNEMMTFKNTIQELYQKQMKFDKQFDLKTDSTQYCAEMIAKALEKSSSGRLRIPHTTIRNRRIIDPSFTPVYVKEFDYIAVDNLFLNPFTQSVKRIKY